MLKKWKMYIESREKRKIEAVYPYVSINGGYAFHKIRLEGKNIYIRQIWRMSVFLMVCQELNLEKVIGRYMAI